MNPKLNDFLKDNKDITLMGLGWSLYWRLVIVMMGVGFVLGIFGAIFE